ncbi:MAG: prolyl oligopeptidase family serine peptidase [Myxococcales bacterium]|nr:prolyl oligopeptidase family serine peptidase [Myxococcales bacterium]
MAEWCRFFWFHPLIVCALGVGCSPVRPTAQQTLPINSSAVPSTSTHGLGATKEAAVSVSNSEIPERLVIKNSEVTRLHSEETGRDYRLIVGLPPSFHQQPKRQYPVLYILDGQWDFPLINALVGGLVYDKVVPEFVLVGIAYGGTDPNYDHLRREDYTPTRYQPDYVDAPFGGDAPKFLNFIENHIIPYIEPRYHVDATQRMIGGSSLGGLFSLYALFERPDLFFGVIAISPAVDWDHRWLFEREKRFHSQHGNLPARLWMSVGDSEWPHFTQANREFFSQFEKSEYGGQEFKIRIIEGERHAGNKPEAYNRGLRFMFQAYARGQAKP